MGQGFFDGMRQMFAPTHGSSSASSLRQRQEVYGHMANSRNMVREKHLKVFVENKRAEEAKQEQIDQEARAKEVIDAIVLPTAQVRVVKNSELDEFPHLHDRKLHLHVDVAIPRGKPPSR